MIFAVSFAFKASWKLYFAIFQVISIDLCLSWEGILVIYEENPQRQLSRHLTAFLFLGYLAIYRSICGATYLSYMNGDTIIFCNFQFIMS